MEDKKYNISYIKNALIDEVRNYYDKKSTINDYNKTIEDLETLLEVMRTKDYKSMDNDAFIILFSTLAPKYYSDNSIISKKMVNKYLSALMICGNYYNNPEKYDERQAKIAENELLLGLSFFERKLSNIQKEKEETLNYLHKNSQVIYEYRKIINSFNNGQKIKSYQFIMLEEFFKIKGYSERDIILLLEAVKGNNNILSVKENKGKINFDKIYDVRNIIKRGFEYIEKPYIVSDRKNEYISLIDYIYENHKEGTKVIIKLLPEYNENLEFSYGYDLEAFLFVCKTLLIKFQNELLYYSLEMSCLANYNDIEYRKLIQEEFKLYENIYSTLRNYMYSQLDLYFKDLDEMKEEEDVNNLFYAASSENDTFLENDLKNIPKDRYDQVRDLLIKLKKGLLHVNDSKKLNEAFPGLLELRCDQIRIAYRHLNNNNYVIIGVFIKKDDNDITEYRKNFRRTYVRILEKEIVEERLFKRLEEDKHYGGRINS